MNIDLEDILEKGCVLPDTERAVFFSQYRRILNPILETDNNTIFLLYFIKPNALEYEDQIVERTLELGKGNVEIIPNSRLEVIGKENTMVHQGKRYDADIKKILRRHYTPTIGGRGFFWDYVSQMNTKLVAHLLKIPNVQTEEQNRIITAFRTYVIGLTDCQMDKKAKELFGANTIRAEFGIDRNYNAVHCSDSITESIREVMNLYSPIFRNIIEKRKERIL